MDELVSTLISLVNSLSALGRNVTFMGQFIQLVHLLALVRAKSFYLLIRGYNCNKFENGNN